MYATPNKKFRQYAVSHNTVLLGGQVSSPLFEFRNPTTALAAATGTIDQTGQPNDGEQIRLNDGVNAAVTFEFDNNSSVTQTTTLRKVVIGASAAATMANLFAAIRDAPRLLITPTLASPTQITLVNDIPGTAGNQAITEPVAVANYTETGMTGGTNNTLASLALFRLRVEIIQTANQTAAFYEAIDFYKCTGFTAVDTAGVATPVITQNFTDVASSAVIRGLTVSGDASGMRTSGVFTPIANPFAMGGIWFLATLPTAGPVPMAVIEWRPDVASGQGPMVFQPNEGFIVKLRTAFGVAGTAAVSISCDFGECMGLQY